MKDKVNKDSDELHGHRALVSPDAVKIIARERDELRAEAERLRKELSNRLHANVNAALTKRVQDLGGQVSAMLGVVEGHRDTAKADVKAARADNDNATFQSAFWYMGELNGILEEMRDTSKGGNG